MYYLVKSCSICATSVAIILTAMTGTLPSDGCHNICTSFTTEARFQIRLMLDASAGGLRVLLMWPSIAGP